MVYKLHLNKTVKNFFNCKDQNQLTYKGSEVKLSLDFLENYWRIWCNNIRKGKKRVKLRLLGTGNPTSKRGKVPVGMPVGMW